MTEPPPRHTVSRLLFKAIRQLPEDEQRVVLEAFIGAAVEQRSAKAEAVVSALDPSAIRAGVAGWAPAGLAGPNQQVVPVRLSEDAHRRLKAWCAENGFAMSVVIRGLVDRFLDSWEQRGG